MANRTRDVVLQMSLVHSMHPAETRRVIREGLQLLKFINLEHHPNDYRIRIVDDEICQTLSTRMGTGGGNVPLVLEIRNELDSVGHPKQTDTHD